MVVDRHRITATVENGQEDHFVIEFPGFVSDAGGNAALETLGGLEGLQRQRQQHVKNLRLKLSPNNKYCRAMMSNDVKKSNLMLLRVPVGKARGREEQEEDQDTLLASARLLKLGQVYRFYSPADIQTVQSEDDAVGDGEEALMCGPPRFLVEGATEGGFGMLDAKRVDVTTLPQEMEAPGGEGGEDR